MPQALYFQPRSSGFCRVLHQCACDNVAQVGIWSRQGAGSIFYLCQAEKCDVHNRVTRYQPTPTGTSSTRGLPFGEALLFVREFETAPNVSPSRLRSEVGKCPSGHPTRRHGRLHRTWRLAHCSRRQPRRLFQDRRLLYFEVCRDRR